MCRTIALSCLLFVASSALSTAARSAPNTAAVSTVIPAHTEAFVVIGSLTFAAHDDAIVHPAGGVTLTLGKATVAGAAPFWVAPRRDPAPPVLPAIPTERALPALPTAKPPPPPIGTTRRFWVTIAARGGAGLHQERVPFTLAARGRHGWLWVDARRGDLPRAAIRNASALARDFDDAWESDRRFVGNPDFADDAPGMKPMQTCDAAGKPNGGRDTYVRDATPGLVQVLLVPDSPSGDAIRGGFDPMNMYPQDVANCFKMHSNAGQFVLVGWNLSLSAHANVAFLTRFQMAHEFSHYIYYTSWQIDLGQAGEPLHWIDEGIAMYAQDPMFARQGFDIDENWNKLVRSFVAAPQRYSLTTMSGTEKHRQSYYQCYGCYGASYVFMRYLTDRFGQQIVPAIVAARGGGYDVIGRVTGMSFTNLEREWAIAIALDGTGYSSDPRFRFKTWSPRATYISTVRYGKRRALRGKVGVAAWLYPGHENARIVDLYRGGFAIVRVRTGSGALVLTARPTGNIGPIFGTVAASRRAL